MQASRWSGTFRVAERNHRLRNAFGITVVTRELHHEALGTKADTLAQQIGPEYAKVMDGLEEVDPNSAEGKQYTAVFSTLVKQCK